MLRHRRPRPLLRLACSVVALLSLITPRLAPAADSYAAVPVERLKLANGATLPQQPADAPSVVSNTLRARAIIDDAEVEAYLVGDTSDQPRWQRSPLPLAQMRIVARLPAGQSIRGKLVVANKDDAAPQAPIEFSVDPSGFASTREEFLRAKIAHYAALRESDGAGAAWFRHQEREARRALGGAATQQSVDGPHWTGRGRTGEFDETFDLVTGGRAISENLQLDRALPPATQPASADVKLDSLNGITVAAMDWTALIAQAPKPQLDPLASLIPADQHAIFFPTFSAAVALVDELQRQGSIVPSLADESRSEDAMSQQRYEKQLCLSLTGLGRLLGPTLVKSVAVTGSDAYLRVGSDIAVLFEPANEAALSTLIMAQVELVRQQNPKAQPISGEIDGVKYRGARSPDRLVCSYVSTVGGVVVVTNSPAQLKRIIAAQAGKSPALAAAPEYTFFRQRYLRTDTKETALIVLSDDTIRRWCGPKWRIADSRRTRAAAAMAELQAVHTREIVAGKADDVALESEFSVPKMNDLRLTHDADVTSSTYGSLAFMTPIAELEFNTVTEAESTAYGRWRDGYQRNWRWAFDPIAIRLSLDGRKIATDLTIMPLIWQSEYTQLVELTTGAALTPASADPHAEAIGQVAVAVNPNSNAIKSWGNFMRTMSGNLRIEPLAWVGSSVSLYADEDAFWDRLASAKDTDKFMEDEVFALPAGLYVECGSALKMAAFLTAVRAYADQSGPGLLAWETLQYGDQQYVKVAAAPRADAHAVDLRFALYYAAMPDALVVSLSEDVVKRAIDRHRSGATTQASAPATSRPTTRPWLGDSLCLQLQPRMCDVLAKMSEEASQRDARSRAWSNIEILNEWKRLFPDRDPLEVHQRLWGVRLVDPAGTSYIWNEQWRSMESQSFGHPGQPKTGPSYSDALRGLGANIGLTFENHGVRARAEVDRPARVP